MNEWYRVVNTFKCLYLLIVNIIMRMLMNMLLSMFNLFVFTLIPILVRNRLFITFIVMQMCEKYMVIKTIYKYHRSIVGHLYEVSQGHIYVLLPFRNTPGLILNNQKHNAAVYIKYVLRSYKMFEIKYTKNTEINIRKNVLVISDQSDFLLKEKLLIHHFFNSHL